MAKVGDIPNNLVVPKELLLTWAATLVRAVCAPCPDDIAEPVRSVSRNITTLMERARPHTCDCQGYDHIEAYPSGICRECGLWYPSKSRKP